MDKDEERGIEDTSTPLDEVPLSKLLYHASGIISLVAGDGVPLSRKWEDDLTEEEILKANLEMGELLHCYLTCQDSDFLEQWALAEDRFMREEPEHSPELIDRQAKAVYTVPLKFLGGSPEGWGTQIEAYRSGVPLAQVLAMGQRAPDERLGFAPMA